MAAGLVMAASPAFLENSRLAFVEAPSLAPTVLAICALLAFRTFRTPGLAGDLGCAAGGGDAREADGCCSGTARAILAGRAGGRRSW